MSAVMTDRIKHATQKGFSLIEMMIAAAIGLLLLSSVMSLFTSSMKHTSDSNRLIRLNQELDSVIDLMAGELRRAGYNGTSNNGTYLATNNTSFGVTIPSGQNSCIVYSYDKNSDGAIDNNEKFGFRLQNNIVQYSESVDSCDGTWQPITDPSAIVVTALTFSIVERCVNTTSIPATESTSGCPASVAGDILFKTKQINIELKGKPTNNASKEKKLNTSVRIRNDQWQQV
jgi:prepilin-type N-terminal cleavage/methylation domain-containing protein